MAAVLLTSLVLLGYTIYLRHSFSVSQLAISVPLLALAAMVYVVARTLHFRHLHRSAAVLFRGQAAGGHPHHVSGVPRWVEQLNNIAFGIALAALIPLVGLVTR